MKRRMMAIAMAAIMVSGIFTGCGSTEETENAEPAAQTEKLSYIDKTKKENIGAKSEQEAGNGSKDGQDGPGQTKVAWGKAGQNNTSQDKAVQNNTSQDKVAQNNVSQDKVTQNNVSQDKSTQNNAAQDTAEQNNMAQDTAVQKNASQDTIVQNNTAQDTTAQKNASQDTIVQINKAQDTAAQNNASQNTTVQSLPSAPAQTIVAEPEQPVHVHTWAEHRVEEERWETFTVFIDDYETVPKWHCNCGALVDIEESEDHALQHVLAGEPANGFDEMVKIRKIGSHEEEQGGYVTVSRVDYRYCTECGARK